jgi:hypothetical protein
MGKAVPYTQDQVAGGFDIGEQWTTMRNSTRSWDVYCRDREGNVWAFLRGMMAVVGPIFKAAATADQTLIARFPNLAAFLGMKSKSAKQAVTTKKANQAAEAKGEPPFHGAVGKKRRTKAEKAAAAAAAAQPSSAPPQAAAHGQVAVTNGTPSPGGSPPPNGAAGGAHS